MPIYEYECRKCKAHTEVMQKISDKPLAKCRKCGGQLEKQWSNTSFQLKGAGWYVTDYTGKKSEATSEATDDNKKAEDGKKADDSQKSDAPTEPAAKEKKANDKEKPAAKKKDAAKPASSNTSD